MRVLHVSAGKLYGGVEVMLLALARHQRVCPDLKQEFAVCFEGRLSNELAASGARVHQLGQVRIRNPFSILTARRRLRELLNGDPFDAVICHMAWAQAIFGPAVRSARARLMLWHHDPNDGRNWLDRWAKFTPPDLAICNSKFTAHKLGETYPQVRTEVLYCPVDLPSSRYSEGERTAVRAELNTPADATVIVQVGRMEAHKGHLLHLEALGRLRDLPGWVCWQVGAAQRPDEVRYVEELKATAGRLGILERVRFPGYWPDLPRLLNAADIYCQPNIGPEGFGISIVEALHARLPVVAMLLGPASELVNESCGILVPPGYVPGLADALRRLINDPVMRCELGSAGPARAAALSDPSRQMKKLQAILSGALRPAKQDTLCDARAASGLNPPLDSRRGSGAAT